MTMVTLRDGQLYSFLLPQVPSKRSSKSGFVAVLDPAPYLLLLYRQQDRRPEARLPTRQEAMELQPTIVD